MQWADLMFVAMDIEATGSTPVRVKWGDRVFELENKLKIDSEQNVLLFTITEEVET